MIITVLQKRFKAMKLNIKIVIKLLFLFHSQNVVFINRTIKNSVQLIADGLNMYHPKQHMEMSFLLLCTESLWLF